LQAILDNSPAMITLKDLDGRYQLVNYRFEMILGMPWSRVRGKTDGDLFPREIAEALRANDREVIRTGDAINVEERVLDLHGPRTYLSTKFPLWDAASNLNAICSISTDITERKRAEQETVAARE